LYVNVDNRLGGAMDDRGADLGPGRGRDRGTHWSATEALTALAAARDKSVDGVRRDGRAEEDEETTMMLATSPDLRRVTRELARVTTMTTRELVARYEALFERRARSHNRQWLLKRITFRIQEQAHGGLSDGARMKIAELGDELPERWRVRVRDGALPATHAPVEPTRDPRLPPPGTTLTRVFQGEAHDVVVEAVGFTYRGERYATLSQVAKVITGTAWNGFAFFYLERRVA
jgi:hypothetical protein